MKHTTNGSTTTHKEPFTIHHHPLTRSPAHLLTRSRAPVSFGQDVQDDQDDMRHTTNGSTTTHKEPFNIHHDHHPFTCSPAHPLTC